mgnify:CR=1 FL=1
MSVVVNIQRRKLPSLKCGPGDTCMASPITLKTLDDLVEAGTALQFVGVGTLGTRCEYWIVVALPFNSEDAHVLVSYNSPTIRTFRHMKTVESLIGRYPDNSHVQHSVLPLAATLSRPEDVYQMTRSDIQRLDPALYAFLNADSKKQSN